MKIDHNSTIDLSAQIAEAIRDAIISGSLRVDARLPSEAELAEQFDVSRPTVREALKRLAAQSLIRTQRGATGGAFVNRLRFEEAYGQHVTTSTLLLAQPGLSDEAFCASDVAFHRALVDAAGNPVMSYQLAGAVEAMQPLMNMITFTARNRATIVDIHTQIADALEAHDAGLADALLVRLSEYTEALADSVFAKRRAAKTTG